MKVYILTLGNLEEVSRETGVPREDLDEALRELNLQGAKPVLIYSDGDESVLQSKRALSQLWGD